MKITTRKSEAKPIPFTNVYVGEVFRLYGDDEYYYIKTNDGEYNSVCLQDGDACYTRGDIDCIVLEAELIVNEVTE